MEIDGPGGLPIAGQNQPEVATDQYFGSFILSATRDLVGRDQVREFLLGPRFDLTYSASWANQTRYIGDESITKAEDTSHRITPMAGIEIGLDDEDTVYSYLGGVYLFFLTGRQMFPGEDVSGDFSDLLALEGGVTLSFAPAINDGKDHIGITCDMGFNRMFNTVSETAQFGFYTAAGVLFRFE